MTPAIEIKTGNVFVQLEPGGKTFHLGATTKPIGLVETGTLRPSLRANWRLPTITISLTREAMASIARLDAAIERFILNMERRARAERRRLWPRWALAFTLFIAVVAIWA